MPPQNDTSSGGSAVLPPSAPPAQTATLSPAQEEEILQLAARIAVLGQDHMSFLRGNTAARTSAPMREAQLNSLICAATATTTCLAARDDNTRALLQPRDKAPSPYKEGKKGSS